MPTEKEIKIIKEIEAYNTAMMGAIALLKDLALNHELDEYDIKSFSFHRTFFDNDNEGLIFFHCLDSNKKPVVFPNEQRITKACHTIKFFMDVLKDGTNYSDPMLGLKNKEFSFTKESLAEMESFMLKPDLKILLEKTMLSKAVENAQKNSNSAVLKI